MNEIEKKFFIGLLIFAGFSTKQIEQINNAFDLIASIKKLKNKEE